MACILVSVVYAAFFMVLTTKKFDIATHAGLVFVMVCLALAALGLIELGSSTTFGTYTPAVLVGVIFISIIGDRWMRIGIDVYAIALVAVVSWVGGLRGSDLLAVVLVYASTIVIITWITARTVGSLNRTVNFRHAIAALNEAIDGQDPGETATIGRRDPEHLPTRPPPGPDDPARPTVWPSSPGTGGWGGSSIWAPGPETHDGARRSGRACASSTRPSAPTPWSSPRPTAPSPSATAAEGELVMVVERQGRLGSSAQNRTEEAAELLAAAFLRVTSRANFVSGLQAESRTDPLTGLANRRTLYERIEIEMDHALRSESPLTVAMIDLDHFKKYNDRFGHVAGDTLLRADRRPHGLQHPGPGPGRPLRRRGVLPGHAGHRHPGRATTSSTSSGRVAARPPPTFGITLSAGLTSWDGIEDTTSFIERADQALYRAKESGRDRVVSIQSFTEF